MNPRGSIRTVSAGATYVVAAIAQRALSMVMLPVFAAYLGPADFGVLALAATASALIGYLLSLGLDTTVMRDLPAIPEDRRSGWISELRGGVRSVALWLGGPSLAIGIAALFWDAKPLAAVCFSIAATAISSMGVGVGLAVLRASERPAKVASITALLVALSTLGRVVSVVFLGTGALGAVLADLLVAPLVLVSAQRVERLPPAIALTSDDARRTFRDGLPMVPHLISHWGLALGDRLIVAPAVGLAQLGIYSLGYQAAFAVGILLTEANRALLPVITRRRSSAPSQRRLSTAQVAGACLLGILAFCFGPALLMAVLPPEFAEASRVFVLVAGAYVLMGLYFVPMNQITMVLGQTRRLWRATAVAAVVNLGLNALLTRRYGIIAAALCTLVSYLLLLLLMGRIWWKMGGGRRESLSVPLAAGWVMLSTATACAAFWLSPGSWSVAPLIASLALATLTVGRLRVERHAG